MTLPLPSPIYDVGDPAVLAEVIIATTEFLLSQTMFSDQPLRGVLSRTNVLKKLLFF